MPHQPLDLTPLALLLIAGILAFAIRRAWSVLAVRRARRAEAEAAEYARITGWITKLRTDTDLGPAVTRDARGKLVLFMGLRTYMKSGAKRRRGRAV